MSIASPSAPSSIAVAAPGERRGLVHHYCTLTKARLSLLVLMTTAVGFVLASPGVDWLRLLWTILGTALTAGAANALNQIMELHRDARMHRTRERPIASGVISVVHGYTVGVVMAYAGLAVLGLLVNLGAAAIALATILIYVLVYTPLKSRTTLNTLPGAVCGALPPVIGWVAATGSVGREAVLLAAILFVWQLPHFFALAWLYREDYERGGFRMLPIIDESGRLTCRVIVLTSLILIPTSFAMVLVGLSSWIYAIGALGLGLMMIVASLRLYRERTDANARRVFLVSLVYLPVLLALLLVDRAPQSVPPTEMLAKSSTIELE
jgi:protoheme IX farnesyltransferase